MGSSFGLLISCHNQSLKKWGNPFTSCMLLRVTQRRLDFRSKSGFGKLLKPQFWPVGSTTQSSNSESRLEEKTYILQHWSLWAFKWQCLNSIVARLGSWSNCEDSYFYVKDCSSILQVFLIQATADLVISYLGHCGHILQPSLPLRFSIQQVIV
jgi:hypothetical protein